MPHWILQGNAFEYTSPCKSFAIICFISIISLPTTSSAFLRQFCGRLSTLLCEILHEHFFPFISNSPTWLSRGKINFERTFLLNSKSKPYGAPSSLPPSVWTFQFNTNLALGYNRSVRIRTELCTSIRVRTVHSDSGKQLLSIQTYKGLCIHSFRISAPDDSTTGFPFSKYVGNTTPYDFNCSTVLP